jgi:acyl carrier protein
MFGSEDSGMDRELVFQQVVGILKPFVKNQAAFVAVTDQTAILRDLKVNSARLVEVVLRIQERFGIQVTDDDADKLRTVGDTVALIERLKGPP